MYFDKHASKTLYICLPLKTVCSLRRSQKFWEHKSLPSWKLFCFLLILLPYKNKGKELLWLVCDSFLCPITTALGMRALPSCVGLLCMMELEVRRDGSLVWTEKPHALLYEQRRKRTLIPHTRIWRNKSMHRDIQISVAYVRILWMSDHESFPAFNPQGSLTHCESISTQTSEPIRGIQTNTKDWWKRSKHILTKLSHYCQQQGNDNISTH